MFTIFPQSFTNPKATKCSRFVHKMQHLCIFNFPVFYSHIPHFITIRNEVAKVMFLQASVCPLGGGGVCLSACYDTTPPRADTPWEQTPPWEADPAGADTPPEIRSLLRMVRILLECILVLYIRFIRTNLLRTSLQLHLTLKAHVKGTDYGTLMSHIISSQSLRQSAPALYEEP